MEEYLQFFSPFKTEKFLGIKYSEVVPIQDAFEGQEYFFDEKAMKEIEAIGIFTDGIADLSKVKMLDAVHFMLTYRDEDIAKVEKNKKSINRTHFARKKFSNLLSKTVPRDDFAAVIYVLDDKTPYIPITQPPKPPK